MTGEFTWLGKAIAGAKPKIPGIQHVTCQVVDLTDQGTANVTYRGTFIPDVPCAESYVDRKPGDTVVAKLQAGQLLVQGPSGADTSGQTLQDTIKATVQPMIDNAINAAALISNLDYGTTAPGPDYVQVANTYIKVDSTTGATSVYFQTGSAVSPPPSEPKVPGKTPDPVSKTATDSGSWRNGRQDSYHDDPSQGDYTGRGDLRGGWFWGTWIADQCQGKTVKSMTLKLTRRSGSGSAGKRVVHLYLHDYANPPATLDLDVQAANPPSLSWGATTTWTVPDGLVDNLASGSAKGFAIYDSGPSDYMSMSPNAVLTINFAQGS